LQDTDLRNAKDNDLADRRTAAADAKAALLRGYQATKDAAEPTRLARQAERLAAATARDERHQERDRIKLEERARQKEQERIQAEAAEHQKAANVAARAQAEAREKTDNLIARVISDEASRKAERDQRYANRKAKQ
jgi:cell division protein FtsN